MQATCQRCNQPIISANLSTAETRSLCSHCQSLLDFSSEFAACKTESRDVHQPIGYTIKQGNDGLHLGYTWRKGSLGFGLLAVILINLLVAWWLDDAFNRQRVDQVLVGLVFLAVSIASICSSASRRFATVSGEAGAGVAAALLPGATAVRG